jgi:chemotaxis protein MotB
MKRNRADGHENADRWLLTYADMITLLMAFFIMMYSMSVLNLSRFKDAAAGIRQSLGAEQTRGMGSGSGSNSNPALNGTVDGVLQPLVKYIQNLKQSGVKGVQVGQDYRGLVITIKSDKMLFAASSPTINPRAYPILDRISESLAKINNRIQIEGHTCNLPPNSSHYETNWELSADRATKVVRYFVQRKGLDPRQFAPVGHGDNYPVAPNNTNENRIKNRRVEIVILRKPTNLAQNLLSKDTEGTDDTNPSYVQRIRK